MRRKIFAVVAVVLLISVAGCADTKGDDYGDAPSEIKDGSLDYQDYKELNCPYLDGSLDQQTMEKCNKWVRENNVTVG